MDNQDLKIQQQNQLIQNQAEKIEELESKGMALRGRLGFSVDSAPTCEHWAMYGANQNGEYLVDPDGDMHGDPPFMAYCDFSTKSTEVLHDSEDQISFPRCSGTGCRHEHLITYQATDTQIESLKSLSQGCKQSITFGCFLAPMKWYSVHHGWWTDRSGNPQYCTDCQCNSKKPVWMEDEISTEDFNLLPMKSFVYGPLKYDLQRANVSIGRLSCSGLKESSQSSGISSLPDIVQKMERIEDDIRAVDEKIDGLEEIRDGKAFFSAYKNSGENFDGIVTFDTVDIDTDNQLDKENGVFTCTIPGTYLFTFSGGAGTKGQDTIGVYVNDVRKFKFQEEDESFVSLSYTWTLELSVDDQVQLKVDAGEFYSDHDYPIYFTGLLVQKTDFFQNF